MGKSQSIFFAFDPQYLQHLIITAMVGATFTASVKAPLTAILLVTEMVGFLNQLMALSICSLAAYFTADMLGVKPINESLLDRLIASHDSKRVGKSYLFNLPVTAESYFAGKTIR